MTQKCLIGIKKGSQTGYGKKICNSFRSAEIKYLLVTD